MSSELAADITTLVEVRLRSILATSARRPFVVGLCGAQGSGKTTVAQALQRRLEISGISAAVLSLDDLYLPREDRAALTAVHPLLSTRGVPGTHDVGLGESIIEACANDGSVALPRFSKAHDTRTARESWKVISTPVAVVLFEGWCVGARPQADSALVTSVNDLERLEDRASIWRRWVNAQLALNYQRLFSRINMLVLMAAPHFGVVARWRSEQEAALRERLAAAGLPSSQAMRDSEIDRFVEHYQRLTEHILSEMPQRADLVIRLDERRRSVGLQSRS